MNAPTLPIIPVNNMNAEVNRPASSVLGVDCTAGATVAGATAASGEGCATTGTAGTSVKVVQ